MPGKCKWRKQRLSGTKKGTDTYAHKRKVVRRVSRGEGCSSYVACQPTSLFPPTSLLKGTNSALKVFKIDPDLTRMGKKNTPRQAKNKRISGRRGFMGSLMTATVQTPPTKKRVNHTPFPRKDKEFKNGGRKSTFRFQMDGIPTSKKGVWNGGRS